MMQVMLSTALAFQHCRLVDRPTGAGELCRRRELVTADASDESKGGPCAAREHNGARQLRSFMRHHDSTLTTQRLRAGPVMMAGDQRQKPKPPASRRAVKARRAPTEGAAGDAPRGMSSTLASVLYYGVYVAFFGKMVFVLLERAGIVAS